MNNSSRLNELVAEKMRLLKALKAINSEIEKEMRKKFKEEERGDNI